MKSKPLLVIIAGLAARVPPNFLLERLLKFPDHIVAPFFLTRQRLSYRCRRVLLILVRLLLRMLRGLVLWDRLLVWL